MCVSLSLGCPKQGADEKNREENDAWPKATLRYFGDSEKDTPNGHLSPCIYCSCFPQKNNNKTLKLDTFFLQEFAPVESSVTVKLKGTSRSRLPDAQNMSVPREWRHLYNRVWDTADYVVPPAENGAFFVTTNVVITPNQVRSGWEGMGSIRSSSAVFLFDILFPVLAFFCC